MQQADLAKNKEILHSRIGVVVIGRNEAMRLPVTLRALLPWGLPLVYVDSLSSDDSVEVANGLGVETLVLSTNKPVSAARARNVGAEYLMSQHPDLLYLQFVDGDTSISPEWLEAAFLRLESQPTVGFVCGQLRERDRDNNIYRRLCDMEWRWAATDDAGSSRLGGMGLIRVAAFKQAGGYEDALIAGEEPELYGRLVKDGWRLQILPVMMGLHDSGMVAFKQWWTRCVKAGYGFANGYENTVWRKNVNSALFWAGLLPVVTLLAALLPYGGYIALSLLASYPLNALRIWIGQTKREFSAADRYLYANALMLMKFAQLWGIAKFHFQKQISPIQYK